MSGQDVRSFARSLTCSSVAGDAELNFIIGKEEYLAGKNCCMQRWSISGRTRESNQRRARKKAKLAE